MMLLVVLTASHVPLDDIRLQKRHLLACVALLEDFREAKDYQLVKIVLVDFSPPEKRM
jgi:hypothetical protein